MALDIFANALDVLYEQLGVEASISALTGAVTVIDRTSGVEVEAAGGSIRRPTLVPAACIRKKELVAAGITNLADIVNASITFNGATWFIISHKPKPTPAGEAEGEIYLILRSN